MPKMKIGQKCQICKKQRHHHSKTAACPVGKRHRILGFTEFHATQMFEAKVTQAKPGSEVRKDRAVRRATKAQSCCACGTGGTDWNPVDPAHIRTFKVTQSDHPANMVPLCRECHRLQHAEGWEYFLQDNPKVLELLELLGWQIEEHPFQIGKLIMTHPEVA